VQGLASSRVLVEGWLAGVWAAVVCVYGQRAVCYRRLVSCCLQQSALCRQTLADLCKILLELAVLASTYQRCTDWAGAVRWRHCTIFAALLVSWRCEQAANSLCVDPSPRTRCGRHRQMQAWSQDVAQAQAIAHSRVALGHINGAIIHRSKGAHAGRCVRRRG